VAILLEARQDAEAGRYQIALSKHIWFHAHALAHQRALYGVRLSFALAYWRHLAQVFPPALTALKQTRDDAMARLHAPGDLTSTFHDLVALNDIFGEHLGTVEAFKELDRTNPCAARRVYQTAEPSLIRASEHSLCGKYLEPKECLSRAIESYHFRRSVEASSTFRELSASRFERDMATLVALLIRNERGDEAKEIAELATKTLDSDRFRERLSSALAGNVPEPDGRNVFMCGSS
jgi:hypothetical protein